MTRSDSSPAQLNRVRAEYVDGDLDHDELEAQLEQSLSDGPSIGEDGSATPPTGVDAITTTITGVWIAAMAMIANWQSDASRQYHYDWGRHQITAVNDDPDPDAHPAEAAGVMQGMFTIFPWVCWGGLAMVAASPAPLLGVPLLAMTWLSFMAPYPTVAAKARGLGRHVAEGGESE